jgi:GNAT superfamily N-acetyltransferase
MPDSELTPDRPTLRLATPADAPIIFQLIQALAEYEKLSHQVTGSAETLAQHLEQKCVESILAESNGQAIGFALFFTNYSTFLTKPGLYLEDLFVLPDHRRRGIGKALILHLAKLANERGCGRLEWSVLDWNEPAIAFYQKIGAIVLPDWRICRIAEEGLRAIVTV